MENNLYVDYQNDVHTCPECGSLVEQFGYLLECDRCLSKSEE